MGVDMEQQAIFSMAMVPFSVKILWAPIVDSISFGKLGWRKPWIVFAQSIVGALLAGASLSFDTLVEVCQLCDLIVFNDFIKNGDIALLTGMYFVIVGCLTIQDISVDGWACSLLSPEYVGMTANLQLAGQLIGAFSWNIYFSFLDETIGYPSFLRYVSIFYLVATAAVLVLVKDTSKPENNSWSSVSNSFLNIFKLLKLKPIIILGTDHKCQNTFLKKQIMNLQSYFLPNFKNRIRPSWRGSDA